MRIVIILICSFFIWSCANQIEPPGGSRDLEAPSVIKVIPQSGTTSFHQKEIVFTFDEYITFSSSQNSVLITPFVKTAPKYTVKGKNLILNFQEELKPNTTYSITFLNAIKDFNEGNAVDIYNYIFSTGEVLDSFQLKGKIINAEDKTAVNETYVGLYPTTYPKDSVLYKQPVYIAKTNASGEYNFKNLAANQYYLAALDDANFNFIYDQITEKVSNTLGPISLDSTITKIKELSMFINESPTSLESYKLLGNNKLYFSFSKPIETLSLDFVQQNELDQYYMNTTNDTLFYFYTHAIDSVPLQFNLTINNDQSDSILIPIKQTAANNNVIVSKDLMYYKNINIKLPFPLLSLTNNKVVVKDSTMNILPITLTNQYDQLIITLEKEYDGIAYLEIDSAAFIYFNNQLNTATIKRIDLTSSKQQSSLIFSVTADDMSNYQIQLYDNNKKLLNQQIVKEKVIFNDLKEGSYFAKIYRDDNQNYLWDTGNLTQQKEAEETVLFIGPIQIKANWDKELNLNF